MSAYLWPALFALFIWWFSTGVIIYLDGLPAKTFKWSMLAATALLAVSIYGLAQLGGDTTVTGAYLAFACGLAIWGWQEMSFLMGYITGPRKASCPPGCRGWKHLVHAVETILWHELAIIAAVIAIAAVTWDQPNQIGLWTFIILWVMRLSAKLNLFLGVRNLNEDFLPDHLKYLRGFLRKRAMNLFFPVTVMSATVICVLLAQAAIAPGATPFEVTGYTFLATLLALAILEHWFLVLPLPAEALWKWGMSNRSPDKRPAVHLRSWKSPLSGSCDPHKLHKLLDALALGTYGDVDRVSGVTRTGTGWIRFDLKGGHHNITALVPGEFEQQRVEAFGRELDEDRLQTAFDACLAPVPELKTG